MVRARRCCCCCFSVLLNVVALCWLGADAVAAGDLMALACRCHAPSDLGARPHPQVLLALPGALRQLSQAVHLRVHAQGEAGPGCSAGSTPPRPAPT